MFWQLAGSVSRVRSSWSALLLDGGSGTFGNGHGAACTCYDPQTYGHHTQAGRWGGMHACIDGGHHTQAGGMGWHACIFTQHACIFTQHACMHSLIVCHGDATFV
eukprot:353363-Chlamydomonas_euryale.AAC.1